MGVWLQLCQRQSGAGLNAPLGLTSAGPISRETIGALVAAVDAGRGILIYAETAEMARELGDLVLLFTGGGHA